MLEVSRMVHVVRSNARLMWFDRSVALDTAKMLGESFVKVLEGEGKLDADGTLFRSDHAGIVAGASLSVNGSGEKSGNKIGRLRKARHRSHSPADAALGPLSCERGAPSHSANTTVESVP